MTDPPPGSQSIHLDQMINIEEIDETDFLGQAQIHAAENPSALLLSGGELRPGDENRYSISAHDPFLTLRGKGNLTRIETAAGSFEIREDPIRVLERIFEGMHPCFGPSVPPFCGGAVGYFAYDLKNSIENLPASACDDLELPDLFFFWPGRIEVYDRKQRKLSRMVLRAEEQQPKSRCSARRALDAGSEGEKGYFVRNRFEVGPLQSNFSESDYLAAVSRVRDYIRRGDVYQVNLSQRFQFPLKGDPFMLWKSLFEINPAPFYAYINAGDHHILSTSMERFLFRKDGFIETRPIKGTRGRGHTRQEDEALVAELLSSPKDDAELSMIVDLMRNDLGRICSPGTVRVLEHKRLETYRNVHHLISIVTGALRPGTSPGDIIRATFPGGSITGCPKIRSMEIIDELEPNVRHVYTGAIGYIGWHDNLDLNVAIRTAIVKDQTCYFSVGGGIVYDSVEKDEYQETLDKGRTLFELIEKLRSKP
jgi:para-aminobenzoate synthetase component 1